MSLLTPDIGLLFWMLVCFGIVFFVLAKFGFPIIVKMVEERKAFIDNSLNSAKEANERLAGIVKESEDIIKRSREEEVRILKEANEIKAKIIADAKQQAQVEVAKMIAESKLAIEKEKEKAMNEINNAIAETSISIAEKIMRKQLDKGDEQKAFVDKLISEAQSAA
ncbi:ATP synthase subunit B [Porphyromonadaceae bacterium COT-184 OH4590]|nr:ATP synthase subunit B [Porphyromonadaceae bacterium COT-184 OH4590]MDO4726662.1 F0F1 ATP synthase subunit B [Porphyromonadaceae bacterium]